MSILFFKRKDGGGPPNFDELFSEPEIDQGLILVAMRGVSKDSPDQEKKVRQSIGAKHEQIWASQNKAAKDALQTYRRNSLTAKREMESNERELVAIRRELDKAEDLEKEEAAQGAPVRPARVGRSVTAAGVLIVGVILLLGSSWNLLASRLLGSGVEAFDYPNEWRAYLVSAMFLTTPVVVEAFYNELSVRHRRTFFFAMASLTALALGAYFATFIASTQKIVFDPTGLSSARPESNVWADVNAIAQIVGELSGAFILMHWLRTTITRETTAKWRARDERVQQRKRESEHQSNEWATREHVLQKEVEDRKSVFVDQALVFATSCLETRRR